MKKHLLSATLLLVLIAASIPLVSACSATTTNQVSATVWSTGTANYTDAAKAADEAVAAITKSPDISVPATLEPGKLTIASDQAYPPLQYLAKVITQVGTEETETTLVVGFEVDLYTAVAKKLGLEPVNVQSSFADLTSVLTDGEVDMVASAVATTPELLNQFAASETYLDADLAICSRSGVELPDEASLQGKVVGVQAGSGAELVVDNMQGIAEKRLYSHVTGAFDDLAAGLIDAVVTVKPVAEWILATDADYATAIQISGIIETGEGYAFWCNKKDQALMDAIDAAIAELRETPESTGVTATTAPSTAEGTATTSAGATSTTAPAAAAPKSVYDLLLEKWSLTAE